MDLGRSNNTDVMIKISNFVDQLHLEHEQHSNEVEHENRPRSTVIAPGLEDAQKRMEHAIVETEKFKATVEKPPGVQMQSLSNLFYQFRHQLLQLIIAMHQF